MRQSWIIRSLLILTLLGEVRRIGSQTNDADASQGSPLYGLTVPVDEVILNFHAADAHGLAVNDLKLDELSVLDKGQPPRKILAFQSLQDAPIRAGILIDISSSMQEHLAQVQAISIKYAQSLLRQQTDKVFIMDFGRLSKMLQPWTNDSIALTTAIRKTATSAGGTTAIFDNIYAACRYQFGKIDHAISGNFILLFSDGEDNSSYLPLKQAVDMCQNTNTAIYVFRAEAEPGLSSSGPRTLAQLASETGGRVFRDNDTPDGIYGDLHIIETDLRNQYRLIYKPADLKHDGSFHRIELRGPDRVNSIIVRSGYYAPAH